MPWIIQLHSVTSAPIYFTGNSENLGATSYPMNAKVFPSKEEAEAVALMLFDAEAIDYYPSRV